MANDADNSYSMVLILLCVLCARVSSSRIDFRYLPAASNASSISIRCERWEAFDIANKCIYNYVYDVDVSTSIELHMENMRWLMTTTCIRIFSFILHYFWRMACQWGHTKASITSHIRHTHAQFQTELIRIYVNIRQTKASVYSWKRFAQISHLQMMTTTTTTTMISG